MYLELQKRLAGHLRDALQRKYDLTIENIPVEIPPDLKFGELATPIALQLARTLRKAPKMIAQEIVAELGSVEAFAGFEVAGAGYINARMDRGQCVRAIAAGQETQPSAQGHVLVEHTSINPNKAAHIGHLRNAILGDSFVRLLRAAGNKVDVQNYIDNTGVQVADVAVGFLHIEKKSLSEIRNLIADCERRAEGAVGHTAGVAGAHTAGIDYYCWDLYTRAGQWYTSGTDEENTQRKKLRYDTLHLIEHGGNETAEVAELISTAVLRRHLQTMLRLGIEYDFLPRESEILHLKFWEKAFELLKQTGVLYFEDKGKNSGCWVMRRPGAEIAEGELDEDAKVIVRSNGTVTYVGKDIAYHLWKFGLLGRDFGYKPFFTYPNHECWISTEHGIEPHPHFGGATAIYNVIDSRQADPQANVIQALRGMGHTDQADHYTHFGYEMVALTPSYAAQLGYSLTDEDRARPYIEISGRKGFGVKADDLMDLMIEAAKSEVVKRHADWTAEQVTSVAEKIAYGALRYYMLRFSRNSVIAFDQDMALSPEGETGPYLMYAAARIRSIFRKGGTTPETVLAELAGISELAAHLSGEDNEDIWALWLRAGQRTLVLQQAIASSEPMHLAKHAFQLAQDFSNFYHHHHILTEEDPAKKTFLLATAAVTLRELVTVLGWLGIESPEAM
ncbi:arginine--tRNA ligase [Occallatibacter riparius]|uniref:arginine--tRNA ligase n=1 Tax=Occallatibacter riparius TaxID=1002689 RepID=A0A9J7BSJ7_9BACT|nr:arginine--tRNA ligase [Occallatibacter riparius]UWZ83878.1 arginine--tRNA ligase [Occallatibacter riparius]